MPTAPSWMYERAADARWPCRVQWCPMTSRPAPMSAEPRKVSALPSRKLVDAAAIAASVPSSALGSVVRMRTPASPTAEPIAAQRVERVFMVSPE